MKRIPRSGSQGLVLVVALVTAACDRGGSRSTAGPTSRADRSAAAATFQTTGVAGSSTTLHVSTSNAGSGAETAGPETAARVRTQSIQELVTLSVGEAARVEQARLGLMAPCLREHGLGLSDVGLADPLPAQTSIRRASLTEDEVDLDMVRAYGYVALEPSQLEGLIDPPKTANPASVPVEATLSEVALDAAEACARSAADQLGVSRLDDLLAEAGGADLDILKRAISVPAYVTAVETWRSCISAAGYQFPDPASAARAVTPEIGWTLPISSSVLTQATADISCRRRARLRRTLDAIIDEERRQCLEQHPDFVRQADLATQTLLETAKRRASG